MLISRAPVRVSFTGGGSDIPNFYKNHGGAVLSTSINKGVTMVVTKKFDDKIRLGYSETENVDRVEDIKHPRAREILKLLKLEGIEVVSVADITSKGSGLGGSSSFTVAMLHALHAHKREHISAERLAQEACMIEIERCGEPIGKQDQYAAAYGGLNLIEFNTDDTVSVKKIICQTETKKQLQENLLMMYTGITRSASDILSTQSQNMISDQKKIDLMKKMVGLTYNLKEELEKNNLSSFGEILHENRKLKKEMAGGISSAQIDTRYDLARKHGAEGGKLLGAGGGGFLLFYAPKEKHQEIIKALHELKPMDFAFENEGSKIIFTYGDY